MALLEVLQFPDLRLRRKADRVTAISDDIRQVVADMYETMYHHNGVGLAATQVGLNYRIFVMDVSETRNEKYCVINPEILSTEGCVVEMEGCLSVQGAYDKIERAYKVHMRGMDINGNPFELHATELMAACIQHEVDHLNGKLFIDHLSRLKQDRIRKKLNKNQKR